MKLPKRRMGKGIPLQWSLYAMIVTCWVLPLTLTVLLFNSKLEQNVRTRMEATVSSSVDNAATILRERLEDGMSDSRASSYHNTIRTAYEQYCRDGNRVALYGASNRYLQSQYSYNNLFDATLLVFADTPELPVFVSSRALQEKSRASAEMRSLAVEVAPRTLAGLDTGIEFCQLGGQLYMLRNLVTSAFEPYAVLMIRLNMNYLLESVANIVWLQDAAVELDGVRLPVMGAAPADMAEGISFDPKSMTFSVRRSISMQDHSLELSAVVAGDLLAQEQSSFHMTLYAVVLVSGLLFALIVTFFYSNISRPVAELMDATDHLEQGDLGYHTKFVPASREFRALMTRFNTVSDRLREFFEKSLLEQQSLHDARIKALQSQINPHFLNNTLEMINWQARMAGDEPVSKMLEALSVMLGAAMARDGRAVVSVREELSYIDAYLYIISHRFGDRLQVDKTVEEAVWQARVPRLILQPIVENAIEHGIAQRPRGQLSIHLWKEESRMVLDVEHDGELTERDRENIAWLLRPDDGESGEQGATRIGIRNVNKRLKILYGPDSGLSITMPEPGRVRSRMSLPFSDRVDEVASDCLN